jgi:predicted transcriptional regulator of viral defense system
VGKSTVENQLQIYTPDVRVARLAAREWGVLSTGELRACGLSDHGIAARARRGRLHRVHRGVYAVGHTALTMRGRFLAAVKACGDGAVLSHVSAAVLWDLVPYDDTRPPDVTATGPRRIAGINAHRTRGPLTTVRYDNIPVTTPARTLIDLSSMLPFKPLRRAIREATARKRITPQELPERLKRLMAPTRSELEDVVLDLITQGGLQPPDVNKPLPSGYIPDFRWPEQRLILEADGAAWHDRPRG